jgi:ribosome-binding protein aMBF1 (putative translation factor)
MFSDEMTESEEKSGTSHVSSSLKVASNCSKNVGEKTHYESETESEQDSQHPDFLEKLDDLIKKFKYRTDGTVRNRRDSYITDQNEKSGVSENCLDEEQGKKLSTLLKFKGFSCFSSRLA